MPSIAIELDAHGDAVSVRSMTGERIPAEFVRFIWATYFPGGGQFAVVVTALDPTTEELANHMVLVCDGARTAATQLRELGIRLSKHYMQVERQLKERAMAPLSGLLGPADEPPAHALGAPRKWLIVRHAPMSLVVEADSHDTAMALAEAADPRAWESGEVSFEVRPLGG
ncbi:hypothetical protein U7230_07550 [Carboxydochorda subterranea]|uniref:Uncharacterized protein n=1 Tax=Carboxydichorda subterranea TaxID=3109565 RepID=A0ABZ1C160_9FIRM|nr:hypothetical protein [Limnochorda sp. L945t]WRP18836.1 hypothetical protein U7230_07550 [Limnochorda sp. L945t]